MGCCDGVRGGECIPEAPEVCAVRAPHSRTSGEQMGAEATGGGRMAVCAAESAIFSHFVQIAP